MLRVRARSVALCEPLSPEDCVVQSSLETSPAKWHLAHTTWFFETFVLQPFFPGYRPYDSRFGYLFNSYYESVGSFHPRKDRGLLTRPTLADVLAYRECIDEHLEKLFQKMPGSQANDIQARCALGLNHEQQHQELMLTDIKHLFWCNPQRPAYLPALPHARAAAAAVQWLAFPAGVYEIGHVGNEFAFDNETPRHRRFVDGFSIASRPVTNGEYIEFVEDRGYDRPTLWLSDGWHTLQDSKWRAPLYWENRDGEWWHMTLAGMRKVDAAEPVCHVSYYEAEAFARWAQMRLPTEVEWEIAASGAARDGNFADSGRLHPQPAAASPEFFGNVWQWTQSAYLPYPGFRASADALGEYNGKFMVNQMVLRGGSCVTPRSHIRASYRNFFYPRDRWQFKGLRLARQ